MCFMFLSTILLHADEYDNGYNDGEVVAAPGEINDAEYMEGYEDGEYDEDRDESSDIDTDINNPAPDTPDDDMPEYDQ